MSADQDVSNAINGVQTDGSYRPWAFVKVRARTVLGNLKSVPFSRVLGGNRVAATPSALDHIIGASEQTSWRYVASDGQVWDLKDLAIVLVEQLIADPKVGDYRTKAGVLRPWPANYPGKPDFE